MRLEKFGEQAEGITLRGDPQQREPIHTRINFPGGQVEVVRARDGIDADYWIHVYVNKKGHGAYDPEAPAARITDGRLDQIDKHAADADVGDFNRAELYHVAMRVTREGTVKP